MAWGVRSASLVRSRAALLTLPCRDGSELDEVPPTCCKASRLEAARESITPPSRVRRRGGWQVASTEARLSPGADGASATALQPPPHLLTTLPAPAGGGRRVCHGASGHGRAGVPSRATGATKSVAPDTPAPVPQPGPRGVPLGSRRGGPRGGHRRRGGRRGSPLVVEFREVGGEGRILGRPAVEAGLNACWWSGVPVGWTVDQPGAVNGLRGDGAWRPSARRGRTRQAPGLAGVAAGLVAWPAWSGARALTRC